MQLSPKYEPKEYEEDIYALWEKNQAFKPQARGSQQTFSIVIPPPNANGDLHLGHGLTLALEDLIVRYHRMLGKKTLFLPGADHAGFETQVVYEKRLAAEGKSRFDFSREKLYANIYDFVNQNKDNYESQFRKIGASLDWSRYVYTLDDKIVDRAHKTFKKMWDDSLIYRGERLVNFCTFHGTGFADIEVAYEQVRGKIYTLKYPLADGTGEIQVATTRPETMLGDMAVAVNPKDKRFKDFVGKTAKLPLTNREIPILADDFVDKDFGTGAVKVTPAHDPYDFEIAERHDLAKLSVIGHDGKINTNAPEKYQNLVVKEARKVVLTDLKDQGFLVETMDHLHSVGHCYKCGTVLEPLLMSQWFIDMKPLAALAIKALKSGKIKFYPDSKKDQVIKYLEGLKDWNISRQIAWGIPIPAFVNANAPDDWIYDERVDQEIIEVKGVTYHRDPDVFDTWFSSASWPYATLDYPDGADCHDFYPLSVMETGADILYPWVSRMIMFGLYNVGKIPFEAVYLHGLINDEHGKKMSKSKGNVVDPMSKIDQYGADAFRMGIIAGASAANDRSYDESRLIAARNLCNKLWNIARFIEGSLGSKLVLNEPPEPTTPADNWILSRLASETKRLERLLEKYEFNEAYELVYHLVWDEVADWYIEASKADPNPSVLSFVLETILKLTHPFAPFVTETIWQTLHARSDSLLITSSWPKTAKFDNSAADDFEKVKAIVSETRAIKTMLGIKGGALYFTKSSWLKEHSKIISELAKLDDIKQVSEGKGLPLSQTSETAWLDVDEQTAKNFQAAFATKRESINQKMIILDNRLKSKSYVQKAPKELVAQTKKQRTELENELAAVERQLEQLAKFYD